jgi:hypothetical protein
MRVALARMPDEQSTHPECAALFGPLFGKPERGQKDLMLLYILMSVECFTSETKLCATLCFLSELCGKNHKNHTIFHQKTVKNHQKQVFLGRFWG